MTTYDNRRRMIELIQGDCHQLIPQQVQDNSVSLIMCDPVYWNVQDYVWLANEAHRVLVDGGNLIMQSGGEYLAPIIVALANSPMTFNWVIAEHLWGQNGQLFYKKIIIGWKAHIWLVKGEAKHRKGGWVMDWIKGGGASKTHHEWQDSGTMMQNLIDRLTEPNDLVLDPYAGSGTVGVACKALGRNYLGYEIDPKTYTKAYQRLQDAPSPLFVLESTQERMEV